VTAHSRRKGKRYELEVGEMLGLARCLEQARDGGGDLEHPDLAIECKRRALSVNVVEAMAQAEKSADGRVPVVIHRVDRAESLVTMRLSDWLAVYDERWRLIPPT
jgi:hypothetical protein